MKLPKLFKNFYFLVGLFFLVWMLFVDSNDIITQIKLNNELSNLESQKEYYHKNIESVKKQYNSRNNDPYLLEKYVRENYLMKKDDEDLYIIVEEKD